MSEPLRKRKIPRILKVVLWTAGVVLAYTVVGFFVVPVVVKSQMLKRLPAMTKRQAAVREVTFNPFTFDFAMRGVSLTESNGDVFAGLDAFHLQFQALSSLSRHSWVFQDVTVTHPFAHVIRRKDGSFNFDNLVETNAPSSATPASLPSLEIQSLRIDGASLEADDFSPAAAFHDKLAPINLQLTNFTIILHGNASAFVFSAITDAKEQVTASGRIAVQPLQVFGTVKVSGVDLKRYGPYLPPYTTAQVTDGKVDVDADYQAALGPKGFDATVTNGTAQLSNLQIKSPDSGEAVVSIPMLTVHLTEASLRDRTAHVSSIKSSGGSLVVRQTHDAKINLLALLVTNAPAAVVQLAVPIAPSAPWTEKVDEIDFDGYTVAVEDQSRAHSVKVAVSDLAFIVKGFDSATNAPLSTKMTMRLNGQGSLSLDGTVTLSPLSGDLAVDLAGLDLPPFVPYVPDQFRLVFSKGRLDVKGRVQGALHSDGPAGNFAGDLSLKDFAAADLLHDRSLFKFDDMAVTGIKISYPPIKLHMDQVALAGLYANVVIDTNRQINLLSVVSNSPAPKTASTNAPVPLPPIELGALVIDKASFHYLDEGIEPHATFDLQELGGKITDLTTQPKGPATVDLHGNVDQFSPFSISGTVEPLAKDIELNLAVSCKNLELTSMSPYMERYGGYPLNKGKLLLQLKYDVAKRKLLAQNKVVIADLSLGARNNSTNATHLPVKLGVALLKDRQGRIDLDIPLSGSLDDPQFRIFPLVKKVVEDLLAKAATSPFTFLSKIVGGRSEELSSVDFAPGETVLAASETAKIKKLAKALYERPTLTLQIAGNCDPASDGAVLARQHLQRRVNKLRAEEEAAAGQAVESVESIKLAPADYARLLQKLYEKSFGSIATNPPAAVVSNVPPAAAPVPQNTPPALVWFPRIPTAPVWSSKFPKGAEVLMEHEESRRPHPLEIVAKPPAAPASVAPVAPANPSDFSAPDVAQMEQRLLAEIHVTDDELRELEQARAKAVESALLQSGQISGERIFILAAKPIHPGAQGQTRAEFSLE